MAMEEEMQSRMATLHKNTSSYSTIRFLGLLKQPVSDSSPFELDESDVIWSSDLSDSPNPESADPISPALSTLSNSPTNQRLSFRPEKFGLSAALSDDLPPLVQRKTALNPSLSAATAVRAIPPVPLPRSGSSSEDFSGSISMKFHQSAPVNVPIWPKGNGSAKMEFLDEDDEEPDEEILPPHEIVARSHLTTFSVFEGVGRTLKGRDLRRVRNAVWQKTGFLD